MYVCNIASDVLKWFDVRALYCLARRLKNPHFASSRKSLVHNEKGSCKKWILVRQRNENMLSQNCGEEPPQELLQSLADSFPERLQKGVRKEGHAVKY